MSDLPLKGLRTLVIDDSKTIRRNAEMLLSREGIEVFLAEDGFDALPKIVQHNPQLILIDIVMQRLDGYQTCALIRHNKQFKDVPIIMLSSKDGLFDRAKGRVVGANLHITKPFSRDDLLNAIHTVLKK